MNPGIDLLEKAAVRTPSTMWRGSRSPNPCSDASSAVQTSSVVVAFLLETTQPVVHVVDAPRRLVLLRGGRCARFPGESFQKGLRTDDPAAVRRHRRPDVRAVGGHDDVRLRIPRCGDHRHDQFVRRLMARAVHRLQLPRDDRFRVLHSASSVEDDRHLKLLAGDVVRDPREKLTARSLHVLDRDGPELVIRIDYVVTIDDDFLFSCHCRLPISRRLRSAIRILSTFDGDSTPRLLDSPYAHGLFHVIASGAAMPESTKHNQVTAEVLQEIREIVGEQNVRTDEEALEKYASDETEDFVFPPQVVVFPTSTAEVSRVMAIASRHVIPVTPRAGGTGLSGGALPIRGGIVLSVEKLNRILEIDANNLIAVVEPGVITQELQEAVEKTGLFYPPDPASRGSCASAAISPNAPGGPRAVKYGVTRDYVLGIEAVLADGTVIHHGGKLLKNSTGYNLTQLIVGSEGTLAVITKIFLRLVPLPKHRTLLLVPFPTLEAAHARCRRS